MIRGFRLSEGLVPSLWPGKEEQNFNTFVWYLAGAAYFYSEFFTIMGLSASDPGIVYVVKSIEPLTTALLAIPILRQSFSATLFGAIMVSVVGIVLTAAGGSGGVHMGDFASSKPALLAMVFAALANIGNSTRSCALKKLYGKDGKDPLLVFGKAVLTGTMTGFLPLLIWSAVHDLGSPFGFTSAILALKTELLTRP